MAPRTTSRAAASPTLARPGRRCRSPVGWAPHTAGGPFPCDDRAAYVDYANFESDRSRGDTVMKIKSVRARLFQWKGKTGPPQGNFCSNAMDMLYAPQETMSTFRFHSWTVVEVETDDGIVGLGNVALAPQVAKLIIDEYLAPLVIGQDPWDYEYL